MMAETTVKRFFSSHRLFWVTCLVIIVFNLAFYLFFIRNQQEEIAALEERYSMLRRGRSGGSRDNLDHILKQKVLIKQFMDTIPEKSKFPFLAFELYTLANKHDLESSKMSFKPQSAGYLCLTEYTTSMKVKGKYLNLKRFLCELGRSKRLFCIKAVSMDRDSGGSQGIIMKMEVSTYLK